MAYQEIMIQVGSIDGSRHIGIKPPLDVAQMGWLRAASFSSPKIPSKFEIVTPHRGEAYSTYSRSVRDNSRPGQEDQEIIATANEIARVLKVAGGESTVVAVDETIRQIGRGVLLFDGQAEILA